MPVTSSWPAWTLRIPFENALFFPRMASSESAALPIDSNVDAHEVATSSLTPISWSMVAMYSPWNV